MAKKKNKVSISNMSRDEQIALVDELIDRDASIWKQYIRDNEFGLGDFLSRRHDGIILRPSQR